MVNRLRHKLYLPYPLLTKEGNQDGMTGVPSPYKGGE